MLYCFYNESQVDFSLPMRYRGKVCIVPYVADLNGLPEN